MYESQAKTWSPAEAAAYIGPHMKESRLRKLAQRGLIGSVKDGRFLVFTKEQCDEYIARASRPAVNPFQTTGRSRGRRLGSAS